MLSPDVTVKEVNEMQGVNDLPMKVRSEFIKALRLEAQGKTTEAQAALEEAVKREVELKNVK